MDRITEERILDVIEATSPLSTQYAFDDLDSTGFLQLEEVERNLRAAQPRCGCPCVRRFALGQ